MCLCVPTTNKARFDDNITVTNPDICLPPNHIQLRNSNKQVHSAITSNQGNDTEGKSCRKSHPQLSQTKKFNQFKYESHDHLIQ